MRWRNEFQLTQYFCQLWALMTMVVEISEQSWRNMDWKDEYTTQHLKKVNYMCT
jgi:hypothetical protein